MRNDFKAVSFMGYLQGEQKYNFEFNPKENFSSFRHLLEKLSDTQALDQERLTILNKNLEDAKKAVNQPFAYEKEFQTKLARLNELNTVLNQEGGRTDMHPEIQALLTKIDQTYTAMVTDPQKYLDYLTFRGQCVGMGAENSVAVFAQNPKATYCPPPEALGSPNVKSGEEDHFVSVLRSDGIERVYALEQYDLPESEYLDNAPLQWTDAQHGDLIHRVEDAAHLADIPIVKDIRHGPGFFEAAKNTIHIREGENDTEQLKSLLEGYSEAVIARTSTVERPVAELESAALAALLQVRCGMPVDGQLSERITTALEDARQVSGFSMKDSVARLHNAMEYCVRYQLMGRPLMSPAQMVRIQRDTWIVEKAGYTPMKTHLEGYWKYLSLAPQEQDSTGENDYLEIKLLSTESLRQALGSAPARPHTPPAATREPRRKLGASRREAAALYPGKFNP